MRLRIVTTAAILVSFILSTSPVWAVAPLAPTEARQRGLARNLDVERAQLRALIRERHSLLGRLAAEESQRSQLLTTAMLSAADAVLAGDAAALDARIHALRVAQARDARRRRLAHRQGSKANVLEQWLVLAAPGMLWSPAARGAAAGPIAWSPVASAAAVNRAAVAPPLAMSLTALTSWAGLLPATAAPVATPSATPANRQPVRSGSTGPSHPASIGDPAFIAPSHGGLLFSSGAGGAAPPDASNSAVATAIYRPVPATALQRRAAVRHGTRSAHTRAASRPTLADLVQRHRAVAAALRQVRTLESWTTAHPPGSALTPNDIIQLPEVLHQRLDNWSATVPFSAGIPAGTGVSVPSLLRKGSRPAVPAAVLGATLALSTTAANGAAGIAIDAVLAASRGAGRADSALSDTALSGIARSAFAVPLAIVPLAPAPAAIQSGATQSSAMATDAAGITPTVGATVLATATAATPSPADGLATATAGITDGTATAMPGVDTTMTPVATQQAGAITATAAVTAQAALTVSVETSTPTLTVTEGLSSTTPLTLVVTLPTTATDALAPPGFASDRGTLDSVLSQGAALFDHLKAAEAGAMQQYRAQLTATVRLNTAIEQRWYAHVYAYDGYQRGLAAYRLRVTAFNAYAHRLHLAQLRYQQWVQERNAWTDYARKMAAYKVAVAARQAPIAPISGTTPASDTVPLPTPPVMPIYPGPEPPPFTEAAPAWPGQPPPAVAPAGLEPGGYALPVPPEAVPPWDGDSPIISVVSYGGMAMGVIAAGREELTQAAVLADGALDGVPAYQDPIKGIITTYWGGQTIFQSFHPGIDIAAPMYTPIHAAAAGIVTYAGYAVPGQRHYSYGLCVVIRHNAHFSTLYAHMDDLKYGLQVHSGDIVQAGQVIGYEGMTGWTTGPHLHFEIRENNIQFNPLLLIPNPQN